MDRLGETTDAPSATQALVALCQERTGGLAFDVGANIGQAARLMAPHFMRVVAFEPCQESYHVLAAEKPSNVEAVPEAVSSQCGIIVLDVADASIATGQLVNGAVAEGHPEWGQVTNMRRVQAQTLDCRVRSEGKLPELVKVDTEGHEPFVLIGARHIIALGYSSWFIEVHYRHHGTQLKRMFKRALYEVDRLEHDYLVGDRRAADHYYMVVRPRSE